MIGQTNRDYNYMYIDTLATAGQTAEPNWLTFSKGTLEYPGGNIGQKKNFNRNFFLIVS